jgi:glycosyltransferase involved in cell wall biosynthesis
MFYYHSVAVVIPSFRVERWITKVVTNLPDFIDHIIVVDDCSPDDTAQIVKDLKHPKVRLVSHQKQLGVGGAMKTGFKEAIQLDCDLIVKMDGDNQMDPAHLVSLLYPLVKQECDFTKGNRFGLLANVDNMPLIRRIGSLVLTMINKFVSGYWHIVDPQNGYFAIRGETLKKIKLEWLDNFYFFENSMLLNLNIIEARVSDVLIPSRYEDEESSMSILTIIRRFPLKLVKGLLFRLFYRYFYLDFSPVFLFFVIGISLLTGGGIWGLYAWYQAIVYKIDTELGTFALGIIPIMMGFQFLLNALNIDIQNSPCGVHKTYAYSQKERTVLELQSHLRPQDSLPLGTVQTQTIQTTAIENQN